MMAPPNIVYFLVFSALWILVSFVLGSRKIRDDESETRAWKGFCKLLVVCMNDLYSRSQDEAAGNTMNDPTATLPTKKLYDNICLVTIARLLPMPFARTFLRTFLSKLPCVPVCVLKLLRLLVFTGSKATVGTTISNNSTTQKGSSTDKDKSKSIRFEALHLLISVTENVDEESAEMALHILLWCCLSEDFEVRYKTISALLR